MFKERYAFFLILRYVRMFKEIKNKKNKVNPVEFVLRPFNRVKKNDGFTLIEILTAVTLFSIFVSVFAGFFIGSIRAQQRALDSQQMIDSISYNLEYMSRSLRMAKKDLNGGCIILGHNYQLVTGRLRFLNYQDKCKEFFLEGGRLKERRSTDRTTLNFGIALPLTPTALQVLSFKIGGAHSWDQDLPLTQLLQPRVTLALSVQKGEIDPILMNIQTTISQRNLNVIQQYVKF